MTPSTPEPSSGMNLALSRRAWLAISLVAAACFNAACATSAPADVIADFDFTGNDYVANPSNPAGANTGLNLTSGADAPLGISVSSIQFSDSLDETAALGNWADDYDDALGFSTDANADRDFNAADQVVYFDVAVSLGYRLDLETLDFDSLKTRGDNATGSTVTHTVFINPIGDPMGGLAGEFPFAATRAHDHSADGQPGAETTGENFSTGRWSAGPIDLTSFRGLSGKNTVAIRMYSSDGSDRDFGIDNIRLSGQVVAIPEPGAASWLVIGSIAMALRRRR